MGLGNIFGKGDYSQASKLLSIKELTHWVDELPLLDTAKSALMLEAMLQRLASANVAQVGLGQRLGILYWPLARLSEAFYVDYYSENQLEPTLRQAQLYFMRELHLTFANLCASLLQTVELEKLSATVRRDLLSFAFAGFGEAILRSYQLSLLLPANLWTTLYQLYALIESTATEADAACQHLPYKQRPIALFKRCLLLAIADPYQLNANELDKFYHFALTYHRKLLIVPDDGVKGEFVFIQSVDSSPVHRHFASENANTPGAYALDLHIILKQLSEVKSAHDLSKGLCDKLTLALQAPRGRSSKRLTASESYHVISGMSALHRALLGKKTPDSGKVIDPTKQLIREGKEETAQETILYRYEYALSASKLDESNPTDPNIWQSMNRSDNGLKLISRMDYPHNHLSSGLLVGLRMSNEQSCQTAFVRWVLINAEREISMGLQLIAAENKAVFVQNERQRRHGYRSCAFLAASVLAPFKQNLLITPVLSYHPGDSLYLLDDKNTTEVILDECLEETAHCKLFSFH